MKRLHLYFDDSGVRRPDHNPGQERSDGIDHFALGGVLIFKDDIGALIEAHKAFANRWKIEVPLHSTKIRGRRGDFAWLGKDANQEQDFLADLETMILGCRSSALHV